MLRRKIEKLREKLCLCKMNVLYKWKVLSHLLVHGLGSDSVAAEDGDRNGGMR